MTAVRPPITADITYEEIESLPEFADLKGCLMVCRPTTRERIRTSPITGSVANSGSAVAAQRIVRGLERVQSIVRDGTPISLTIWDESACADDPTRCSVRLFHFPTTTQASAASSTPWVLVIPGGGYQSVCNAFEGFPAAAELNAAGYHAFVLSYRVRLDNLMPRPIDDVAQAIRYIRRHTGDLNIDPNAPYAVMGFSAGGHLAAEWGTTNHGYATYELPKPAAFVLAYPPIDVRLSAPADKPRDNFTRSLIDDRDLETLDEFSINLHMSHDYPDTFIWQCRDDDVVPFENLNVMVERLEHFDVPHQSLVFEHGGHALMKPHDEIADRWMEQALPFLQERLH